MGRYNYQLTGETLDGHENQENAYSQEHSYSLPCRSALNLMSVAGNPRLEAIRVSEESPVD
jgi:hypothetical protein